VTAEIFNIWQTAMLEIFQPLAMAWLVLFIAGTCFAVFVLVALFFLREGVYRIS